MKTQKQLFYEAHERQANLMKLFVEIQQGDNPLTDEERRKLADKRPQYEFMRPKR